MNGARTQLMKDVVDHSSNEEEDSHLSHALPPSLLHALPFSLSLSLSLSLTHSLYLEKEGRCVKNDSNGLIKDKLMMSFHAKYSLSLVA